MLDGANRMQVLFHVLMPIFEARDYHRVAPALHIGLQRLPGTAHIFGKRRHLSPEWFC